MNDLLHNTSMGWIIMRRFLVITAALSVLLVVSYFSHRDDRVPNAETRVASEERVNMDTAHAGAALDSFPLDAFPLQNGALIKLHKTESGLLWVEDFGVDGNYPRDIYQYPLGTTNLIIMHAMPMTESCQYPMDVSQPGDQGYFVEARFNSNDKAYEILIVSNKKALGCFTGAGA